MAIRNHALEQSLFAGIGGDGVAPVLPTVECISLETFFLDGCSTHFTKKVAKTPFDFRRSKRALVYLPPTISSRSWDGFQEPYMCGPSSYIHVSSVVKSYFGLHTKVKATNPGRVHV